MSFSRRITLHQDHYPPYTGRSEHCSNSPDSVPPAARTAATRRIFPPFCLKDFLELNLHLFKDNVAEIVAQSKKEAEIEKNLHIVKTTWCSRTLGFNRVHPGCPLLELEDVEETVELVETHSLLLSSWNRSQGIEFQFFRPVAEEWSEKLRTIADFLELWQKIQMNWSRLEPIFMLSEDIRSQLPQDSKRFEQVDGKWKELMLDVAEKNLVVEICCAEGPPRLETLKEIYCGLETCEKALEDYFRGGRKAFPRFYFVGAASVDRGC